MTAPVRLEHVIARNMAGLREERRWTQADLAWEMKKRGLNWTCNTVTQIETLRRPISLLAVAALCALFSVEMTRLLAGDEEILAPDGETAIPLDKLKDALRGEGTETAWPTSTRPGFPEDVRRIAKTLGLNPDDLTRLAEETYGRSFIQERDARASDAMGLSRSARTKRGHVTRSMIEELRDRIHETPKPPLTWENGT